MFERDRYLPGVPCWVDTFQPDPPAAAEFYGGLFGWEVEDVVPPEGGGHYFIGRIRGEDVAAVGSPPPGAPAAAVWNTYIWVDSADETAQKVEAAGGTVVEAPMDVTDAGRVGVFADLEGAIVSVFEPNRHRGAQVVNEPGSLNFNTLSTRDIESAKAFYDAVFGWETIDAGGEGMWCLAPYGDLLERRNPGTRERMAEMGAPKGFENVVAAYNVIPGDQPEVVPHWSVTFGTADADETAERATRLGGRVIVAPFDAPWVRMAVIADPAGATFVASQFVAENRDVAPSASAVSAA
jgi:predicted enzyme related to lactoylglutathione lyase